MTARVYLVDHRELVREGLRAVLEAQPDGELAVTGGSSTFAEAVARVPAAAPDVVITAAVLPDGRGLDLCRELRGTAPAARCLLLLAQPEKALLLGAIQAGAAGVVLEDAPVRDLAAAVLRVASGDSLLDAYAIRRLLDRMPPDDVPRAQLAALSERQRAIVELIGDGCSNRDVAAALGVAEKTVKNNVTRILDTLGYERRTQLAALATRLRSEGG